MKFSPLGIVSAGTGKTTTLKWEDRTGPERNDISPPISPFHRNDDQNDDPSQSSDYEMEEKKIPRRITRVR